MQLQMNGDVYLIGDRPPRACQVCRSDLQTVAYDVVLPTTDGKRSWFWTCGGCYASRKAVGKAALGINRGQRYEATQEGRWMLAGGGDK